MKIAVVECGSIGRRHIEILLVLGVEVVAWSRNEERRNAAARNFKIEAYEDLDLLPSNSGVEAEIVCSPNNLHIEYASQVIASGFYLFVEKPGSVA